MRLRVRALILCGGLGLSACGTGTPPDGPTLQLPFTSSATTPVLFNGSGGVLVGETGYFGFGLLNAGTQSLVVQTVTYSGDPAMSLGEFGTTPPVTLAFNDEFVIPLVCMPLAAEAYAGTVSITSNAVNSPETVVYLSCVGMP